MFSEKQKNTFEFVKNCLDKLSWPIKKAENESFIIDYQGQYDSISLAIHTEKDKIVIIVDPVVAKNRKEWGDGVRNIIKNLNQDIHLIELGFDEEDDIFVKVEASVDLMDYDQFHFILISICQVCEQLLLPVLQTDLQDRIAAA